MTLIKIFLSVALPNVLYRSKLWLQPRQTLLYDTVLLTGIRSSLATNLVTRLGSLEFSLSYANCYVNDIRFLVENRIDLEPLVNKVLSLMSQLLPIILHYEEKKQGADTIFRNTDGDPCRFLVRELI